MDCFFRDYECLNKANKNYSFHWQ
uniref:Uncharacterized protein n=1 Tax=Rhizophora mucronata TaxID=61149 RepID=A0A2P2PVX7_RHIMU